MLQGRIREFAQVLGQTKEFLDKDRYGIVRNLAPAMKLRMDAILTFEKSVAPDRSPAGQANSLQLAQALSRNVDKFTAAAEARDKGAVNATFPNVDKAFRSLAAARNFDDLMAPPVTAPGQPSKDSIEQQLQDYITTVFGGK